MTASLRIKVRTGRAATACAVATGLLVDAVVPLLVWHYAVSALLCGIAALALAPGWLGLTRTGQETGSER